MALLALALLEISMLAALAALNRLSQKNHGFVHVTSTLTNKDFEFVSLSNVLGEPFLWTTIPTLFMTLFALAWAGAVGAYAEEVPFRALRTNGGSSLEKSVLLDYRRYFGLYSWWLALRYKNVLLAFCILSSIVLQIVLVPISAHLFQVITPDFELDASLHQHSLYNDSPSIASIDYWPILGTVAAVRLFGGNWPLWTDGQHAIASFSLPHELPQANVSRVQFNTEAYGAILDCAMITDYNISKQYSSYENAITLTVSASDRGCDIAVDGGVGPGSQVYLKTQNILDCSASAGYSRIAFFAGTFSASATYKLADMSVISCIPRYYQSFGTVSAPAPFRPLSFQPHPGRAKIVRPSSWINFEEDMLALSNIGDNNSPDFTSQFGELILGIASTQGAPSNLSESNLSPPDSLMSAASSVFSSIYAILARTQYFQTLSTPIHVLGTVTTLETRLSVVSWSAYTAIAILAVLILLTIALAIVVHNQAPILAEEPHGVLGAASLLHGSNLWEIVHEANYDRDYQGQISEWLSAEYELGRETCGMDESGVISVKGMVKRLKRESQ
jgi:hypothetical protein